MKQYDILIVDIFNLYYRNHFAFKDLKHKVRNKVIHTGGIYGSLRSLKIMVNKHLRPGGKVFIASDNFSSKVDMRKSIDPHYKANRDKQSKEFYRAIKFLLLILANYSDDFVIIQKQGVEADDFIPAIIESLPVDKEALMVSTDLDWARSIDYQGRKVDWMNGKEITTAKSFEKKYGFMPTEGRVILYKTIRGDRVDNIKIGVPNLPKKVLINLLEYRDIFAVLGNLEIIDDLSDTWKKKIRENASRLKLNHQLVSFIEVSQDDLKNYTSECKFNSRALRTLYKSLGFKDDFDPRVEQTYNKKIVKSSKKTGFFRPPELPRV